MQVERLGRIDYEAALAHQRELLERRAADLTGDTLPLLAHPSVYTAGKRTLPEERPFDGTRVIDVDRGGKITWHGPGQLVGYPIVKLADPVDVVAYVRTLEAALMEAIGELGLGSRQVEGRSGVWTLDGERKIAAIGIRVSRGVTMHGFALNCDCDLAVFDRIVPCGIRDATVTSLSAELGKPVTVADALPIVERIVLAHLASAPVPA